MTKKKVLTDKEKIVQLEGNVEWYKKDAKLNYELWEEEENNSEMLSDALEYLMKEGDAYALAEAFKKCHKAGVEWGKEIGSKRGGVE